MDNSNFELKQAYVRLIETPVLTEEKLDSQKKVIDFVLNEISSFDREAVCVINLNTKLRPINYNIVSIGSLDASIVHPREFLKTVFLSNAAGIIMVHSHPSGDVMPSQQDIEITNRLKRICEMCEIKFLDHIIVGCGTGKSFSFHEKQMLVAG